MLVENKSHKAVFHAEVADIPQGNPKINDIWFAPHTESIAPAFLAQLKSEHDIQLPGLFLDFIAQCGGFEATSEVSYPCALNDMTNALQVAFPVSVTGSEKPFVFTLFDGFILPGGSDYLSEIETIELCFEQGDYDDELQGRDWRKLIPFANDDGVLLCLDYNLDGEPAVVCIEYDGVALYPAFPSFKALLLALDYQKPATSL